MERYESKLDSLGFGFHTIEEELLDFYHKHKVNNRNHKFNIISRPSNLHSSPSQLFQSSRGIALFSILKENLLLLDYFKAAEILLSLIGGKPLLRAFSVSSLSTVPVERFAALFRERARWEWKDLELYIRDLQVPGLSAEYRQGLACVLPFTIA